MYNDPKLTIENTEKKVYKPPTLIEYGIISEITQSGPPGGEADGFLSSSYT